MNIERKGSLKWKYLETNDGLAAIKYLTTRSSFLENTVQYISLIQSVLSYNKVINEKRTHFRVFHKDIAREHGLCKTDRPLLVSQSNCVRKG